MASLSDISAFVASQTGKIQGELESKVLSEAFRITDKFRNECPTVPALLAIVDTKNTLLKSVNSFSKRTSKFGRLANRLLPIIRAAKALIRLLKRDPRPIATGIRPAPDWGGLISSYRRGSLNSSADRLRKADKLLEALQDDVLAIKSLVGDVDPSLNQVRKVLNSIDTNILDCIVDIFDTTTDIEDIADIGGIEALTEEGVEVPTETATINIADITKNLNSNTDTLTPDQVQIKELLSKIQVSELPNSEGVSEEEFTFRNSRGNVYTLEIVNVTEIERLVPGQGNGLDQEIEKVKVEYIAPKRYAQARNTNGTIVVRGPASFSADIQILLDEVKFKLESQFA